MKNTNGLKNKPGAGRPVVVWDKAKIERLKLVYPAFDYDVAASKLGVSESALKAAAARFGVTKKKGFTDKEKRYILKNINNLTYEQLAAKIGTTKWKVRKFWMDHNKAAEASASNTQVIKSNGNKLSTGKQQPYK